MASLRRLPVSGETRFLSFFQLATIALVLMVLVDGMKASNSLIPPNVVGAAIVINPNIAIRKSASSSSSMISQLHFQECVFIVGTLTPVMDSSIGWLRISAPLQLTYREGTTTFTGIEGYVSKADLFIVSTDSNAILNSNNLQSICPTMSDTTASTTSSSLVVVHSNSANLYSRQCISGCSRSDLLYELSYGTLLSISSDSTSTWKIAKIITTNGTLGAQTLSSVSQNAYILAADVETFTEAVRDTIAAIERPLPDSEDWKSHEIVSFGLGMLGWKYLEGGRTSYNINSDSNSGVDSTGLIDLLYLVSYGKRLPRNVTDLYKGADTTISMNGFHVGDLLFLSNGSDTISHAMIFAGKESDSGNEYIIEATTDGGVLASTVSDRLGVKSVRSLTKGQTLADGSKIYWGSYFERSIQDQRTLIEALLYAFVLGTIFLAFAFIIVKNVYKRLKNLWKGSRNSVKNSY